MKSLQRKIYENVIPKFLRRRIGIDRAVPHLKELRESILSYYEKMAKNEITNEQSEVLEYLRKNKVELFPYNYIEKYDQEKIDVYFDAELGLHYVLTINKMIKRTLANY